MERASGIGTQEGFLLPWDQFDYKGKVLHTQDAVDAPRKRPWPSTCIRVKQDRPESTYRLNDSERWTEEVRLMSEEERRKEAQSREKKAAKKKARTSKRLSQTRKSRKGLIPSAGTLKSAAFGVLSLVGSKGLSVREIAVKIQESGTMDLSKYEKGPEGAILAALIRDDLLFEHIGRSTYRVRAASNGGDANGLSKDAEDPESGVQPLGEEEAAEELKGKRKQTV